MKIKRRKVMLGSLSIVALVAPISVVAACGSNNESTKTKVLKTYAMKDKALIEESLSTNILKTQLEKHIESEKKRIASLNEKDLKNKIEIVKTELSQVDYTNNKISYKIEFITKKQGITYTKVEEAKNADIFIKKVDGKEDEFISITTFSTNNRIDNAPKESRTTKDDISIKRLFGKWDDSLEGISSNKETNIVQGIKLFHTNDIHGRFTEDDGKYNKYIGMDGVAKYVFNNSHDLFLSGGDFMQGTGVSNYDNGKSAMQIANIMGYDAIAAGNHEFDFGYKTLIARSKTAPIYSTNTTYNTTKKYANFNPSVGALNSPIDINAVKGETLIPGVRTKVIKGDLPVGIISLTTPDLDILVSPKNIVDIEMKSMYTIAQKEVDRFIHAGINLIIVVGHMGNDNSSSETSERLAKNVKGIDIIVDGHSHELYEPGRKVVRSDGDVVYLGQTGSFTRNIGEMNFDFDRSTGKVLNFQNVYRDLEYIHKTKSVSTLTPNITKIIDAAKNAYANYGEKNAFKAKYDLLDFLKIKSEERSASAIRNFETSMGDFFADALLWEYKKENAGETKSIIGFTNSGGVRTSVLKGPTKYKDWQDVSPFNNTLEAVTVSGENLWKIFEHSAKQWGNGGFAQISKNVIIEYEVYSDYKDSEGTLSNANNKLKSISIDGKLVDKNSKEIFVLVTNDFTKAGGDGYKELLSTLPETYSGGTLSDILIAYGTWLSQNSSSTDFNWDDYKESQITPKIAKRIKIIGKDNGAKEFIKKYNSLKAT